MVRTTRGWVGAVCALQACLVTACSEDDEPRAEEPSAEVKALADDVESSMDTSADPCVDFYRYACGGWLDTTILDPGEPIRLKAFDGNVDALTSLFDEVEAGSAAERGAANVGAVYGSCMDEDAIAAAGIAPLRRYLDEVSAVDDADSLMLAVAHLHDVGVQTLFSVATYAADGLPKPLFGLPPREPRHPTSHRYRS